MKPLQQNEAQFIQRTLAECGFNRTETARRLCISRETLYRKLWKFKLVKTKSAK